MIKLENFKAYFNSSFWKAFKNEDIFLTFPKNAAEREELVEELYISIKNRKYYPSTPQLYLTRNKGKGVSRIIPVFSIKDYCVYYYCIKIFEEKIAYNRIPNTFGGWTLGGKMRKSEEDEMLLRKIDFDNLEDFLAENSGFSIGEYSFNPLAWTRAYGDMNAKLYATAKMEDFKYVAELDIANFYDSIRLDILEARIREIANNKDHEEVSLLFHFLNYWNRHVNLYNKQIVGLPQDAMGDCSRILANFYLQPYDEFVYDLCQDENCRYFRYADDQFIFADSEEKLKFIIFKISHALNKLGLSINQKKVKIRNTEDLIKYRSFEMFNTVKEKCDREDKEKVQRFVEYYLDILEKNDQENKKEKGYPLLTRAIFCSAVKDIDYSKKIKLIGYCLDDDYLEAVKAKHFEKIYNLIPNSERATFIDKLNTLSGKLFHNTFHYQVLSFFKLIKADSTMIKERISVLEAHTKDEY